MSLFDLMNVVLSLSRFDHCTRNVHVLQLVCINRRYESNDDRENLKLWLI